MMRTRGWLISISMALAIGAIVGQAQTPSQAPAAAPMKSSDPRVGLKAGLHDAGTAIRNLELVSSVERPQGFFDPKNPAGEPVPPERSPNAPDNESPARGGANGTGGAQAGNGASAGATSAGAAGAASAGATGAAASAQPGQLPNGPARPRPAFNALNFANSDLAFSGTKLFVGNFNGFNTYDVETAKKLRLVASVVCPGGQGDMSVRGNLLVMSVEQTRGRVDCGTQGVTDTVSKERFRGVRIFDITDLKNPKQVADVQTCRGSHTHTLVDDPKDKANFYIYGSGTSAVRSGDELDGCSNKDPKDDPNTSLFSIDVIQVPVAAPQQAKIVNRPRLFADPSTGALNGLWPGGSHGAGMQSSRPTAQCHDITVFPEIGLAAGACTGNGILLDISDPVHPKRLDAVTDGNFAFWHSATFNNDGTKVIFTDEWGGGLRPRCRATDLPNWGADAIFDIVDNKLKFAGYFKMPAPQTDQENCVAHNGSLVPVPGRDIMVQAWYQGGISIFDFTDSSHPVEIAYFDRGPIDAKNLVTGGYWSAYYYNGLIYGSEIARGVDVFKLKPSEFLTENEIEAAAQVRVSEFNAQEQPKITWPATSAVARAYVDQLTRSKTLQADKATAVTTALAHADKLKSAKDKGADAVLADLDKLATQFASDATSATGRDAARLHGLAETLKGRAASLRGPSDRSSN